MSQTTTESTKQNQSTPQGWAFRSMHRGASVFMREESGASAVEYTAMIALITAISISMFASLGAKVGHPIDDSVVALEEHHAPDRMRDRAQIATHKPKRHLPSVSSQAAQASDTYQPREYLYFTSLALCTAACLVLLIRRRVKGVEEKAEAAEEVVEEGQLFNKKRLFEKRQQILNILTTDVNAVFDSTLPVRNIMSKRVTVVHPKTPVEEIRREMEQRHLRHLVVCEEGYLVGILSDRDVMRRTGKVAKDIMTPNPATVTPDSAIVPAVTQLVKLRVHCLPVTENGYIRGVLTTTDLMMTLQCTFQMLGRVAKEVRESGVVSAPQLVAPAVAGPVAEPAPAVMNA